MTLFSSFQAFESISVILTECLIHIHNILAHDPVFMIPSFWIYLCDFDTVFNSHPQPLSTLPCFHDSKLLNLSLWFWHRVFNSHPQYLSTWPCFHDSKLLNLSLWFWHRVFNSHPQHLSMLPCFHDSKLLLFSFLFFHLCDFDIEYFTSTVS